MVWTFDQHAFSDMLSLRIRWLHKLLLSCHSVWVGHFCFAFFSRMGLTVIIGCLVLILFCQGENVQNGRWVLVFAGCLIEHVMVELKEEEYNAPCRSDTNIYMSVQPGGEKDKTLPTFSSRSVSWSYIKDTSLEKDGRLQGSRAQHLHIIPYLEKKVMEKRWKIKYFVTVFIFGLSVIHHN